MNHLVRLFLFRNEDWGFYNVLEFNIRTVMLKKIFCSDNSNNFINGALANEEF